jgi:hypothetical protein
MSYGVIPVAANSSAVTCYGWKDHVLFFEYTNKAKVYYKHDLNGELFKRLNEASSKGAELQSINVGFIQTTPVSAFGTKVDEDVQSGQSLAYIDVFDTIPANVYSTDEYMLAPIMTPMPPPRIFASINTPWSF